MSSRLFSYGAKFAQRMMGNFSGGVRVGLEGYGPGGCFPSDNSGGGNRGGGGLAKVGVVAISGLVIYGILKDKLGQPNITNNGVIDSIGGTHVTINVNNYYNGVKEDKK